MSSDFQKFNFDRLERELEETVAKEKQYWLENDAKIRAVKQGVPTYDHFRELVNGAHLKPLEKGEKMDEAFTRSRNQPWNMHASSHNQSSDSTEISSTALTSSQLPSNHAAFNLQWKRCGADSEMKFKFLMRYPEEKTIGLDQVFKTDLPVHVFSDCIAVLNELFNTKDHEYVLKILADFSTSKRFKLTLDFLSKREKIILSSLFDKLDSTEISDNLKAVYKIK
ncbi:coiled-coil domain-containing protein 103-like [Symsagittifera roscoffensis]|uniref:coiled-coil domain-containing protein 103-like n=1 Tax=Symsagittifera roscoffensis TaxID=84072 RepID=UPI00307C9E46